ncbi:MAG TPA: host attachment protein [Dyella sp.]|nr:host attachment protein [Dyella sp.]
MPTLSTDRHGAGGARPVAEDAMKHVRVVVANRSVAHLFQAGGAGAPLHELDTLLHPASRLHDRDLVTDRPGRSFDRVGQGHHATDPGTSPGEHEAERFAIELARRLHKDRAENRFRALVLVADPGFLGLLRAHLDEPTRQRVVLEIDKNLAHMDAAEIRAHLPDRLTPDDG